MAGIKQSRDLFTESSDQDICESGDLACFQLAFSNMIIYWAFMVDNQEFRLSKRGNQGIFTIKILILVGRLSTNGDDS